MCTFAYSIAENVCGSHLDHFFFCLVFQEHNTNVSLKSQRHTKYHRFTSLSLIDDDDDNGGDVERHGKGRTLRTDVREYGMKHFRVKFGKTI